MYRGLLVVLVALAFMPATRGSGGNSDMQSDRAETRREAPSPTLLAQRCFVYGGRLVCF
jgi:hypothetical protein